MSAKKNNSIKRFFTSMKSESNSDLEGETSNPKKKVINKPSGCSSEDNAIELDKPSIEGANQRISVGQTTESKTVGWPPIDSLEESWRNILLPEFHKSN